MWVGSSQGVFIIDLFSFAKSRKRFDYTYLRYKLDDPESGKIEKINSILEDHEGNIWLGGNGSGLYKLSDDKMDVSVLKIIQRSTDFPTIQY